MAGRIIYALSRLIFSVVATSNKSPSSFAFRHFLALYACIFSLRKCVQTHQAMYPCTINQKIAKYLTKSATRMLFEGGCRVGAARTPSRFSSRPNAKIVEEHRGRFIECAHEGCFPNACVSSEKIAKYIRARLSGFDPILSAGQNPPPRLEMPHTHIRISKNVLSIVGVVNKELMIRYVAQVCEPAPENI